MPKNHDVEMIDNSPRPPSFHCYTCSDVLIYVVGETNFDWLNKVEQFSKKHPSPEIETYKNKLEKDYYKK